MSAVLFFASDLRVYQTLRRRRKPLDADCPLRVYSVENLSSSCLFGNVIYVAAETASDETRLRHVLVALGWLAAVAAESPAAAFFSATPKKSTQPPKKIAEGRHRYGLPQRRLRL